MLDFTYEPLGEEGDIICFPLTGSLNAENCDFLFDCIEGRIEAGYTRLILNCEGLSYISSLGLGMLVRVHSRMKRIGGDVKLAHLDGAVGKILHLIRLDRVLQIYPSVEEAAASFGES